ncbi:MAG: elongation factor Tu [Bacteroidota bacterium]
MAVVIELRYDIRARITLVLTEEGGRKTPAVRGYRPQFYYSGRDWDALPEYIGVEQVEPGQTFETYLHLLSPECHYGKVTSGMPFEWREGARVVGQGVVLELLELERAARETLERDPNALESCRE